MGALRERRNVPQLRQQRRDAALQELDAAVAARIQVDPQFKKYVDAVKDHDNNVKDFVKQKKQTGGGK